MSETTTMDRDEASLEAYLTTYHLNSQSLAQDADATLTPTFLSERATIGDGAGAESLVAAFQDNDGPEFEDLSVLGRGGMGIVTLARQDRLSREVAIKRVRGDRRDARATAELLKEATLLGRLEHPNIVPVHSLEREVESPTDVRPALVMKRIEGETWEDILRGDEHGLLWHLRVLLQVCDALRFAHARGVVHRDIKPNNVMLGAFGEVYLLDWGIALDLRDADDDSAEALVGTPAYMAPEMVDPSDDVGVDERTDVYLLGAVLYQLITGRAPHQCSTVLKSLMRAYEGAPPAFDGVGDIELREICTKAMAKHKEGRYDSVDAFRSAVEAYLGHVDSIRLSARAMEMVDRLQMQIEHGGATGTEVDQTFGEAGFGFRQALEIWPGNRSAHNGLCRLMVTMAKHQLRERDHNGATRAIAELRSHDPDHPGLGELETAHQELGKELAAAEAELVRLQSFDRAMDERVADRYRAKVAIAVALVCVGPGILYGILEILGAVTFTYPLSNALVGAVVVESIAGILIFRKKLIQNTMSLRIALMFLVLMALLPFMNLMGYLRGLSALEALTTMPPVGVCGTAAVAVLVDRRMFPIPIVYTVAYVAFSLYPEYAVLGIALANFAVAWFLAWTWSRKRT